MERACGSPCAAEGAMRPLEQAVTREQELFDIGRGSTTLGWNGNYLHDRAKDPEGVVRRGGWRD